MIMISLPFTQTMRKLKDFLDQRLITGDQPFSHDFDIIDHRNCNYDSTQGLDLDLDKVLGGDVGTVSDDRDESVLRIALSVAPL